MENQLQIFEKQEFGKVRAVEIGGQIYEALKWYGILPQIEREEVDSWLT